MTEPQTWFKPYRYEQPPFGRFGEIATVGDRLVCHLCGRDWLHLATHAALKHGIGEAEYKRVFGLNRTTPLTARSVSTKLSENARRHTPPSVGKERMAEIRRMAEALRSTEGYRLERNIALKLARTKTVEVCNSGHPQTRSAKGRLNCAICHAKWKSTKPRAKMFGPPRPRSLVGDLCPQGHPWDGYMRGGKNPQRVCRQCNRDHVRRWRQTRRDTKPRG